MALATSVLDAAQALLDAVVDAGAEHGVTLPNRRYVTAGVTGEEAWDGPQVVVGLLALGAATSAVGDIQFLRTGGPGGAVSLPSATFRVEIVREVPGLDDDGNPPKVAKEQAAGERAMGDAQLLHYVRGRVLTNGLLDDGEGSDAAAGPVTPAGPAGYHAGMSLAVTVTLP